MALVKRQPKKLIRVMDAAAILQVSRSTFKNLIVSEGLKTVRKPTRTSPIRVYEAEVKQLAQEWGIY